MLLVPSLPTLPSLPAEQSRAEQSTQNLALYLGIGIIVGSISCHTLANRASLIAGARSGNDRR